MGECIFITGGIRSGKSSFAQELAKDLGGAVLFVATAEGRDEEMQERIRKHKKTRPSGWRTLEITANLAENIAKEMNPHQEAQVVIVDCLNMLISNILLGCSNPENPEETDYKAAEKIADSELASLEACIKKSKATFIVVSNEVGMGLVSPNKLARCYQDLLGTANQRLAQFSGEVYFMVSGIPLKIK